MTRDNDAVLLRKWAETGDVQLPSAAGLNRAEGWPLAYSQVGGAAPEREVFNQLFKEVSAGILELNTSGPFLDYDIRVDYNPGVIVKGSDGQLYEALGPNGPSTVVADPVTDVIFWVVSPLSGNNVSRIGLLEFSMTGIEPPGCIELDGSDVSRTLYDDLFAQYGTFYGAGDGVNTFTLPDFRGYTLRGWDNGAGIDPDALLRLNRGDGTTGDAVGTRQMDEFESHTHAIINRLNSASAGPFLAGENNATINPGNGTINAGQVLNSGGNESRMKNINVMICARFE